MAEPLEQAGQTQPPAPEAPAPQAPAPEAQAPRLTRRVGVVSSTKGDKTIRVIVTSTYRHPRYGKYLRRQTKVAVHDPRNAAKLGDVVEIVPCRRISRTKSWRLMRVIRAGQEQVELPTGEV
jgi:small subunit ribosomal protein S17